MQQNQRQPASYMNDQQAKSLKVKLDKLRIDSAPTSKLKSAPTEAAKKAITSALDLQTQMAHKIHEEQVEKLSVSASMCCSQTQIAHEIHVEALQLKLSAERAAAVPALTSEEEALCQRLARMREEMSNMEVLSDLQELRMQDALHELHEEQASALARSELHEQLEDLETPMLQERQQTYQEMSFTDEIGEMQAQFSASKEVLAYQNLSSNDEIGEMQPQLSKVGEMKEQQTCTPGQDAEQSTADGVRILAANVKNIRLHFSRMLENEGALNVWIEGARGLKSGDLFSKSDPYCICHLTVHKKFQTKVFKQAGNDPDWFHGPEQLDYHNEPEMIFLICNKPCLPGTQFS